MENVLIEDAIEIREKFNVKALYYEINYAEKKVENDPIFRKWLESQKRERGENGKAFYCRDCKLFYYFIKGRELAEAKRACPLIGYICEYCGELIFGNSLCCIRGGIKNIFYQNLLKGQYDYRQEVVDCLKLIPPFFYAIFFVDISAALFVGRRKSKNCNLYHSFIQEEKVYITSISNSNVL